MDYPPPDLSRIDREYDRRRVRLTVSSTDSDDLERVAGAGDVLEVDGARVQRMHNGLLVEAGSYGGEWTVEIIRALGGVHEPQEEVVFDALVRRMATEDEPHRMIEFGSFWSYYSMWFARDVPRASVLAMEPDPWNLEVGRRNAAMNGVDGSIDFLHGAVGSSPGEEIEFINESDGQTVRVEQWDLASLMARQGWDDVDLLLIDIQGAETVLLEGAREALSSGLIRFIVVSTHHVSISKDALTHQRVLGLLESVGAHIVSEHSVQESYSGDGLIVAALRPDDSDITVPVSRARSRDSLFGELEWEVGRLSEERDDLARRLSETSARADLAGAELHRVTERMRAIESSVPWRLSAPARGLYRRLRRSSS